MLRSLREVSLGQTPKIKTYRHTRAVIEALFACIIVGLPGESRGSLFNNVIR